MEPRLRREAHYGRVMRCFAERPPQIDAMFRSVVARRPDAEALALGDIRVSYRELDVIVERVAGNLAACGVGKGERVALLLGNRLEFVYLVLATARLGAIAVPMNPRQRAPETAYMLNQCGAKALVFDVELAAHLPRPAETPTVAHRFAVGGEVAGVRSFAELDAPAHAPAVTVAEEDVFCILYTSGTTGRPKGAMLTHFGVIHSLLHFKYNMEFTERDCGILAVPASHVTGLVAIILAMIAVGGRTVMMPAFKARDYLALAARERATCTIIVPAMYNLCLLEPDFDSYDLSSWRIGGYGGAPMPEATIAKLAQKVPKMILVNAYGATETTSPTTMMPLGHTARCPDSVGKVLPCGDVVVVDEAGREVPAGAQGEIWIAGPMVVPGYWDNPEANDANFTGGYWRSGDIGSVDREGYVRVFDRKKDMINRGGYKVYSIEVENVMARLPGIVECAVVGRPDPVLGEKVQAFVLRNDPSVDEGSIRAFCADCLSDYKVPDRITFLDAPLPRNPNGKVIKTALRDMVLAELEPAQ